MENNNIHPRIPDDNIFEFRNLLVNDALKGMALLAIPTYLLSFFRLPIFGVTTVTWIHLAIVISLLVTWLLMNRIGYMGRASVILLTLSVSTYSALLEFGPAANTIALPILLGFGGMLFLGLRAASLIVLGNLITLSIIGWAAVSHTITFPIPDQQYIYHIGTWINLVWELGVFGVVLTLIGKRMIDEVQQRCNIASKLLQENAARLAELCSAKRRLQATLNNSPNVAVQWYDRNGGIVFWNNASERLFGWAKTEALGKTLDQLLLCSKEKTEEFVSLLAQIERQKTPIPDMEFQVQHKDGSTRVIRSTLFLIEGESQPLFACLDVDVTLSHQQALLQRAILECLPDAVILSDANGKITFGNLQAERLFGYGQEELVGKPVEILVPKDLGSKHLHHRSRFAKNPTARSMGSGTSLRAITKNGNEIPIDVSLGPVQTACGQMVVASIRDVTQRVATETKLRESEERFSFAVEGAGDGVWDWNILTGEMLSSYQYKAMLGYAPHELADHIDAWAAGVHPYDLPRAKENLNRYLSGDINNYTIELRLRCRDDSYKWVLCRGTIVARDSSGQPSRMIGIHSDITQNKQLECELMRAREVAEHSSKAKSMFLASMSHELRTPLNSVIGFAEVLSLGFPTPLAAVHKEPIQHILNAGRHLLALVNDVLDLAHIESGYLNITFEPVKLSSIIEQSLAATNSNVTAKKISVSSNLATNDYVRADPLRLKQVLINLLSNAIKYNKESGKLEVRTLQKSGCIRLEIEDTGIGIDPELQKLLFKPFQRLGAEKSAIEGTGIGLLLTKRLITAMQGNIGFTSIKGSGSTFWIELPIVDSDSKKTTVINIEPSEINNDEVEGTVVYVEDNCNNVELMRHLLSALPRVRLQHAASGEIAINLIQSIQPDLILMDINLPGISGFDVLKHIKTLPHCKQRPVIAISALASPEEVAQGLNAGFSDYLTKPIDISRTLRAIKMALET